MILIDETMLTNGTLYSIFEDLGHEILYRKYTKEELDKVINDIREVEVEDEKDEDGTYFRTITTEKIDLLYTQGTTNIYQLVVYFPANYNHEQYQDIIELLEINVNAQQITDENG